MRAAEQSLEIGPRALDDRARRRSLRKIGKHGLRQSFADEETPAAVACGRKRTGGERGAQQRLANRPAAGGDQNFALAVTARRGLYRVHRVAGIAHERRNLVEARKGHIERHEGRVAVDQHQIVPALHPLQHLADALGLVRLDQNVAHRGDGRAAVRPGPRQQRLQLEAQLPAAEGEKLRNQNIGPRRLIGREQRRPPPVAPVIVDGVVPLVRQLLEIAVHGAHRRKLHQLRRAGVGAGHRQAARGDDRFDAGGSGGPRQRQRAAQMADAEQVLNPEEDLHRKACTSRQRSRGRPPGATSNRCAAGEESARGGRSSMSHPAAAA